jgi:hypothetical protein
MKLIVSILTRPKAFLEYKRTTMGPQSGKRCSALGMLVAAIFLFTLAGCGSGSGSNQPTMSDAPPVETTELECVREGYPCSFAEVDIDLLEKSDALGDEVLAMWENGASTAETAAWLEEQPDMAEVDSDELGIRFRLEGARGVWVLREGALSIPGDAPGQAVSAASLTASTGTVANSVVAEETKEKKALVLSPYKYVFREYDSASHIDAILKGTKGYEGRVEYLENKEELSSEVNFSSFMGWQQYQVIFVSSHGRRLCPEDGQGECRAVLNAGRTDVLLPPGPESEIEKIHNLGIVGVELRKVEKKDYNSLVLTAEFFRDQYRPGLEDKLIFFDACQIYSDQSTDLANAILGAGSVFFGWTDAVYTGEATETAVALFTDLSEKGYPAKVAYDHLGALKTLRPTPDSENSPELKMSPHPDDDDLRIRDVVTLLNPASGEKLAASDRIGIQGTQGDGVPDDAPYLVRVEGVKEAVADEMIVTVSVDGAEAEPVAVSDGEAGDDGAWLISGVVPLPYDLQQDTEVTYSAQVSLHDGGESSDEKVATLTGEEPIMGRVWELEATSTSFWTGGIPATPYTATTHMTLTFADGQDPQEPYPEYVVTGGTVNWDYSHTYYDCTYTASPITFDAVDYSGQSVLIFDTTTTPVTYSGDIYTLGPRVEVAASCGDLSESQSQKANNYWLKIEPPDSGSVSADNTLITGTYRTSTDFTGYAFVVESTYTINRIE